jgi:hypothetical protein
VEASVKDLWRTPVGKLTVALVAVVAAVLVFGALGYLNAVSKSNTAIDYARRGDCRADVSAAFQPIERRKDDAESAAFRTLVTVIFDHVPPGTPLTDHENKEITDAYKTAGTAATAAAALPTVPDAVEHGYTLDGRRHAPCPTVG